MNRTLSPLRDPELVEMLAEEPELLAIADALFDTQHRQRRLAQRKTARRRQRWAYVATATAVAAGALALFFAPPWRGGGSLVGRALAAVGNGPVLHVVTEQRLSPGGWYQPVSLATGRRLPVTMRQEIWFDRSRDLKKTIRALNGIVYDRLLETPEGGFTSTGPVYTCAWIAAHPVEATKARVSCNANMQNGARPRHIPEQPPTLDLALAGFVDQYRSALASGRATRIGTGEVDGHPVIWLRIVTSGHDAAIYPREEDVAIDASSYAPVLVRMTGAQPLEFKVLEIDTQTYDPALFTRPRAYPPLGGETEGTSQIDPAQAPALLGGKALWLGQSWNGYRLVRTERQNLMTGYGPQSGRKPTHSVGVIFTYAPAGASADSAQALQIKEADQCEDAWGMHCGLLAPREGIVLVGQPFFSSFTVRDGIFIAISQQSAQADPVLVANVLQPFTGMR